MPYLDASHEAEGTQFKFRLNADGQPDARNTDLMPPAAFAAMLDQVEAELARMGREIYSGAIAPNPYQRGAVKGREGVVKGSVPSIADEGVGS